ncbi:hypothetical protein [Xanthobacter sp. KR7-225]|uniref:hypothetical protein n=1 Tax=Xanthobacter sp. KR7-225 TaxID=3156613 RepID=UPI0032B3B7B6
MDDQQGRGPHPQESATESAAKDARRRRRLVLAMAAVAGALSLGFALLRGFG